MKYLKRFNENISIYNKSWEVLLPNEIWVIKGGDGKHKFIKGNIMLNTDMIQITYNNTEPVIPDTLEFDIYFSKIEKQESTDSTIVKKLGSIDKIDINNTNPIKLDIDITYGDLVACEFSIDKTKGVKLIQSTSYGSKFDTSNTVFAFDKISLEKIVEFLSRFNHGLSLNLKDFKFLSE